MKNASKFSIVGRVSRLCSCGIVHSTPTATATSQKVLVPSTRTVTSIGPSITATCLCLASLGRWTSASNIIPLMDVFLFDGEWWLLLGVHIFFSLFAFYIVSLQNNLCRNIRYNYFIFNEINKYSTMDKSENSLVEGL